MKRRNFLSALVASAAASAVVPAAVAREQLPQVTVYKNAYCGCCGEWVKHMEAAGFAVTVNAVDDTAAYRNKYGIPSALASCHTAVVAGYALEGHVPAQDVKRLLAGKPAAVGLAVPGMPSGAPGMQQGGPEQPYKVLLVDRKGSTSVFAAYPAARANQAS